MDAWGVAKHCHRAHKETGRVELVSQLQPFFPFFPVFFDVSSVRLWT